MKKTKSTHRPAGKKIAKVKGSVKIEKAMPGKAFITDATKVGKGMAYVKGTMMIESIETATIESATLWHNITTDRYRLHATIQFFPASDIRDYELSSGADGMVCNVSRATRGGFNSWEGDVFTDEEFPEGWTNFSFNVYDSTGAVVLDTWECTIKDAEIEE